LQLLNNPVFEWFEQLNVLVDRPCHAGNQFVFHPLRHLGVVFKARLHEILGLVLALGNGLIQSVLELGNFLWRVEREGGECQSVPSSRNVGRNEVVTYRLHHLLRLPVRHLTVGNAVFEDIRGPCRSRLVVAGESARKGLAGDLAQVLPFDLVNGGAGFPLQLEIEGLRFGLANRRRHACVRKEEEVLGEM
jgi:hypothetical protein